MSSVQGEALKKRKLGQLWNRMCLNKWVYIMFIPALVYFAVFSYSCYYGISIAFKDYSPFRGIIESQWVGLQHFKNILNDRNLPRILKNTLKISILRIIFQFPVPIAFALMLNEIKSQRFKKVVQTICCFPNFISWVVYAGIVYTFTSNSGVINTILTNLGLEPINMVTNPDAFYPLLIITDCLKGFGWASIIYMASFSSMDSQLYEAAALDGAGRWKQTWHVTLPALRPTICLNLVMSVSGILNAGFDQVFLFLRPALLQNGEIIDTYVWRMGLVEGKYEYSTAVGLLKSVVGIILIVTANKISRKMGEKAIW